MESSTLIAHCGANKLTLEELTLMPVPSPTNTHKPIPHHEIVNALIETLMFRKIGVHRNEFACTPDGNKMFGLMELEITESGVRFAIGIRNSHDRTMALGITVGYRVLVCDNMAFNGEFAPVLRKHTKNANLVEAITLGVDSMQRNFKPMIESVRNFQQSQITEATAKLLIYEAFVEGGTQLPKHLMRPVHDGYFNPQYPDFQPRTMWSLANSFTGAIKALDPIPAFQATASVAKFFDARKLI